MADNADIKTMVYKNLGDSIYSNDDLIDETIRVVCNTVWNELCDSLVKMYSSKQATPMKEEESDK